MKTQKLVGIILRRLGRQRGKDNENRFFSALANRYHWPSWVKNIERASAKQDRYGIDAVLDTTDVGRIFIQIKSSEKGRQKFESHPMFERKHIVVIIIRVEHAKEEIRENLWRAIKPERQRLLELRKKISI